MAEHTTGGPLSFTPFVEESSFYTEVCPLEPTLDLISRGRGMIDHARARAESRFAFHRTARAVTRHVRGIHETKIAREMSECTKERDKIKDQSCRRRELLLQRSEQARRAEEEEQRLQDIRRELEDTRRRAGDAKRREEDRAYEELLRRYEESHAEGMTQHFAIHYTLRSLSPAAHHSRDEMRAGGHGGSPPPPGEGSDALTD